MSLANMFRLAQSHCDANIFQAWKLGREYQQAAEWYTHRLPPTLLAVEQQEVSGAGKVAWRPVTSHATLLLGTPTRLRCWMWGADAQQYAWTANNTCLPATPALCPLHNVFKSEVVIDTPGSYQCVATSPHGRSSEPLAIEVIIF